MCFPCKASTWIIFLIAYILSPVDMLPEAILGPFGLIDDGAALVMLLFKFLEVYRGQQRELQPRNENRRREEQRWLPPEPSAPPADVGTVHYGSRNFEYGRYNDL
jgi:uncharacterized membrane protein YkvA (DUF1232 family)